ncbi:MAG: hypothetical protein U0176_24440 [Bacteroidia bacterium]
MFNPSKRTQTIKRRGTHRESAQEESIENDPGYFSFARTSPAPPEQMMTGWSIGTFQICKLLEALQDQLQELSTS